jgi:NAD(P)-dependent dehydrogenase (short-subunit alcohol dehydrogenase family)
MKSHWTSADIPDLKGRTAVVTGANSGIGYEVALQLASNGAHVVLASRNPERTAQAARQIATAVPGASVEAQLLDLGDLSSVRRFADQFCRRHAGLDILLNNAGISGGPRRTTVDGLEAHFQVNYLGHFALTGLLLQALRARAGSRVVTLSSDIASQGKIDFDDLQSERSYRLVTTYAQSKLANLLFAFELDRRSRAAGAGFVSLSAHPGIVKTPLLAGKEAEWGRSRQGMESVIRVLQLLFGKSPAKGAWPVLYQATEPAARSADYVGPSNALQGGYPGVCKLPAVAFDAQVARRLWEVSQQLSAVHYESLSERTEPGKGRRLD